MGNKCCSNDNFDEDSNVNICKLYLIFVISDKSSDAKASWLE